MQEAAKQLLEQLNQIKVEEKEMKKKEKEEKKEAHNTACKEDSSSSSSESSESDCDEPQILQLSDLKASTTATITVPNPVSTVPLPLPVPAPLSLPVSAASLIQTMPVEDVSAAKIEVCMGGKCKKAGSLDLLHEFEKKVGSESGALVVACKCMGKCKEGPNVKVSSRGSDINGTTGMVQGGESVKVLRDQLCIGVGLEDVGPIVAHFLGEEEEKDSGSLILV